MMNSKLIAPAPWSLSGTGVVILYHFPAEFAKQYGFMAPFQLQTYKGWLGAIMLVDYQSSNVGPYQELLFIPGLFRIAGKLAFSVSKIYVSTEDSLHNGYRNWGIPKELAKFDYTGFYDSSQPLQVRQNEQTIFSTSIKPWYTRLPFTSKILPFTRLIQQKEDRLLLTSIEVSGHFRLASIPHLYANQDYFPPLQQLKPLAALSIADFQMQFPEAQVLKD